MIVFGTRGVKSRVSDGVFFCPHCQKRTNYSLIEPKRFIHLFFVPLIPIATYDRYVECRTCGNTYLPRVLDQDPVRMQETLLAEYNLVLLQSMCLVALADNIPSAGELDAVRQVFERASGASLGLAQLRYTLGVVGQSPQIVGQALARLSAKLKDQAREYLVYVCFLVALQDGQLVPNERRVIEQIAEALQISPFHFRGIIADVTSRLNGFY